MDLAGLSEPLEVLKEVIKLAKDLYNLSLNNRSLLVIKSMLDVVEVIYQPLITMLMVQDYPQNLNIHTYQVEVLLKNVNTLLTQFSLKQEPSKEKPSKQTTKTLSLLHLPNNHFQSVLKLIPMFSQLTPVEYLHQRNVEHP